MPRDSRRPEGREVETSTIKVFSRVAGWTGLPAAWRVRRILGDTLPSDARILDIGTGPGTIPLHLARFYPAAGITGLDVSWDMLKEAGRHNRRMATPITLLAGDGEQLPVADNSLDAVLCFFALHHIEHPDRFLREIHRALKPEGTLLLIDFRRDIPAALFHTMNALWQLAFLFSSGRKGFRESVESAWRPEEIEAIIAQYGLHRFSVRPSRTELVITSNIKEKA